MKAGKITLKWCSPNLVALHAGKPTFPKVGTFYLYPQTNAKTIFKLLLKNNKQ
jgi:hypothetical protein